MKNKANKTRVLCAGTVILTGIFLMSAVTACADPGNAEKKAAKYTITVKNSANGTVSAGKKTAPAGETISLDIAPDTGYTLSSIRVTGAWEIALDGSGNTRTFTMPAENVMVSAVFQLADRSKYRIIINQMTNGTFESSPADSQYENHPVQLTAQPNAGYKYRPGSLRVTGANSRKTVAISQAETADTEWNFEMPAENAEVDASFIDESTILYGINIIQPANGSIECIQDSAVPGDTVIITLVIDDDADYRYAKDSVVIAGTDSGSTVDFEPDGELQWAFVMPAEAVTVKAAVEFIPYHTITAAAQVQNGRFIISGTETEGDYTGRARPGSVITITAAPDSGYKLTDEGLSVIPPGAAAFTRLEGQPAWTFNMADTDLEIGIAFAELGPLEIYRGGAGKGIRVGGLSDDPKYYENSIDMESDEGGHNGNQRAIKVIPALNANGNAVQQSFGLFSDTEIPLNTVTALSFWAKSNKNLNIRYAGFGDADPDKRVVYTGEDFNQQIALTGEWKRYIVPVPASGSGQKTARVFFFNASIAAGNYVCIDDIEFIESGVTISGITIPETCDVLLYGAADAAKLLKGAPLKLRYDCTDGTTVTLQCASNSHTLKDNLAHWLTPFIKVNGNVSFSDGIITPREKDSAFTLTVNMAGVTSNPMSARIVNGLLLDDFEDTGKVTIPGTPAAASGYLWHTTSSGSTVVVRDYVDITNKEIYSGLGAGSWRSAATANKPRGGRNFDAQDAAAYDTLIFRVKVTTGGASLIVHNNTVFTFELKNGGTLTNKTNGAFFAQQFTYVSDGTADDWQEIRMPLAAFVDTGLDITAITGYAIGVVDNQGAALRIMLDDIALVRD
ncbi:MAG: hypothetical protein LBH20_00430 [Treponema sp.]|jgi:hypothetical protein|nr:hypothetical protein [Treponema sp.]